MTVFARLADLLVDTRDGDWGVGAEADDHSRHFVIRGADFPDVGRQNVKTVPCRYLPDRTVWRRVLRPNDILLETAGGTRGRPTGRSLLITEDILRALDAPVIGASFTRFLRADHELIDPRYLYWYLQYLYSAGKMFEYQVQHTGIARFQYTVFSKAEEIAVPHMAQQIAIADVMCALDDKTVANRRQLELMDQILHSRWQQLYESEACDSEVGLSDVVKTQYGLTASAGSDPDGLKFLRVTDINKANWLTWSSIPTVAKSDAGDEKYILRKGDLLVARMADPGKSAIYDDESVSAVFASYLVRLQPRSYAEALYVYGYLKSKHYLDYAAGATTGSVQKNMNARVIVDTRLRWPTQPELQEFAEAASTLRSAINAKARESQAIEASRDELLPLLMSGKVRVKDAETVVSEVS